MSTLPFALGALLALAAVPCKVMAQSTWTVDDNGPADFASIAAAAATVPAGDVLLIHPGEYGIVNLNKELTLLGLPSGTNVPHLAQLNINDCAATTVADLNADSVHLTRISGRSQISGVRTLLGFVAQDVGELFVARSVLDSSAAGEIPKGPSGVDVLASLDQPRSRAQFVDCTIKGGMGPSFFFPGLGGDGIVIQRADVLLIQCRVQGGTGFNGLSSTGTAGAGVVLFDGKVEVRGGPEAIIAGGPTGATGSAVTGPAFSVSQGNPAILAGGAAEGAFVGVVQTVAPRPYLTWNPAAQTALLELFSLPGDTAIWVLSLGTDFDLSFVPLYGLGLTLDLQLILTTGSALTQGMAQPVGPTFGLPTNPALFGLAIPAQALVLNSGSGLLQLTNGDDLVLGP
jgi:hypothetical protein